MKSLHAIRQSARAKREEIATVNSTRDAAEHARRVEVAKRESALREKARPALQSEEERWEAMATMRPWETLISRGDRTWVE
jgi:hypothetical protein